MLVGGVAAETRPSDESHTTIPKATLSSEVPSTADTMTTWSVVRVRFTRASTASQLCGAGCARLYRRAATHRRGPGHRTGAADHGAGESPGPPMNWRRAAFHSTQLLVGGSRRGVRRVARCLDGADHRGHHSQELPSGPASSGYGRPHSSARRCRREPRSRAPRPPWRQKRVRDIEMRLDRLRNRETPTGRTRTEHNPTAGKGG